ncbi:MAG: type VI secretion system amidase effector protein Tae4 [Candidatus Kapabacteria bacterium]|nr:type VI secretion system amidase effector protein Tae4 [Candidatus Kapabacteria bacterium]
MTKILIFFLVAILIIIIVIGLVVKSFRNYLNNFFKGFEMPSKNNTEQSKNKVIYEKNGIVVMKGESKPKKD